MKKVLKNDYLMVKYDLEEKEIFGRDLEDRYNEPCFYNNNKRIKKGIEVLEKEFTDGMTMWQAIEVLQNNGVNIHSYCAVD